MTKNKLQRIFSIVIAMIIFAGMFLGLISNAQFSQKGFLSQSNKSIKALIIQNTRAAGNDPVKITSKGNLSGAPAGGANNCVGGIPLGVPIPARDPNKGGFYIKYCADDMKDYMKSIYNVLIVIAVISALIMTIYGGYMYIMSSGDATKITTAKETIIGALIGLALLLSASLIISSIGIK